MEEIINFDFLKNPLKDSCDVKKTFGDIAKKLFQEYCINCNGTEYYFAEIEFYYYEKGRKDGKCEEEWNSVTYARDGYSAGDLFYHLSGIDICFESHFNSKEDIYSAETTKTTTNTARYGGILIRSVTNVNDGTLIAGPLNCKDELLNACKGSCMPKLEKLNLSDQEKRKNIVPKPSKRFLGKDLQPKENSLKYDLCFRDGSINEWRTTKIKYIKSGKGIDDIIKKEHPKYNRFNQNENK